MSLLVLGYPKFNPIGEKLIDKYRKKYDALYYNIVATYLPFVFPVFDISEKDFIEEIRDKAEGFKKIELEFCASIVNWDSILKKYNVFMAPEKGFTEVIRIHDKLYSGKLFPYRKLDTDYIPHIGIGNSDNSKECIEIANELNAMYLRLPAIIDSLHITYFEANLIKTISRIDLI